MRGYPLISPLLIMRNGKVHLFLIVLGALLSGCGERGPIVATKSSPDMRAVPGVVVTNALVDVEYSKLPGDAVMACVGDRLYLKGDLDHDMAEQLILVKKMAPSPAEAQKRISEMGPSLPWDMVSRFLSRSAFALEGERCGVVATDEDLTVARRSRAAFVKATGRTDEAYCAAYPGGKIQAERVLNDEALNRAVFRHLFTNSLEVTEKEIDEMLKDLTAQNEVSAATNRILKAKVQDYRRRLIAAKTVFSDNDERNQALVEPGYAVDVFTNAPATIFSDEVAVPAALQKLNNGEWSEVFEGEETYDIYQRTGFLAKNFQAPALYSGVKVSLPRDLGFLVPDRARARADIRYFKNVGIVQPKTRELLKEFGVRYPNGFVWKVKAPKQRRKSK